jgi:hypothetical protein
MSSSDAISSSSGGVIEFRNETGNAMVVCRRDRRGQDKIDPVCHVMRRVGGCLVKVGPSRLSSLHVGHTHKTSLLIWP